MYFVKNTFFSSETICKWKQIQQYIIKTIVKKLDWLTFEKKLCWKSSAVHIILLPGKTPFINDYFLRYRWLRLLYFFDPIKYRRGEYNAANNFDWLIERIKWSQCTHLSHVKPQTAVQISVIPIEKQQKGHPRFSLLLKKTTACTIIAENTSPLHLLQIDVNTHNYHPKSCLANETMETGCRVWPVLIHLGWQNIFLYFIVQISNSAHHNNVLQLLLFVYNSFQSSCTNFTFNTPYKHVDNVTRNWQCTSCQTPFFCNRTLEGNCSS